MDQHFTIKSVCQLTGLNEHTLRAWERRYGAVQPQRLENGRRVYTARDVERLRSMVQLVQRGYGISRIADLSSTELAQHLVQALELEAKRRDALKLSEEVRHKVELAQALKRIEFALANYELASIQRELAHARAHFGARIFALELVSPLMGQVGRLVAAGDLSVAQEHALSAMTRAHLNALLFDLRSVEYDVAKALSAGNLALNEASLPDTLEPAHRPVARPVFAIATMEGDFHEIGILISTVLCADRGISAHYIGPSLPPEPLAEVANALGVNRVLIGSVPLPQGTLACAPSSYIARLTKHLSSDCELWIGGDCFSQTDTDELEELAISQRLHWLPTLVDFDAALATAFNP